VNPIYIFGFASINMSSAGTIACLHSPGQDGIGGKSDAGKEEGLVTYNDLGSGLYTQQRKY